MESRQLKDTMGQEVPEEFKTITNYVRCFNPSISSYKPSLVEIEFLGKYIIQRTNITLLNLDKIILTAETGSRLGKLLSNSQIDIIFIDIRSDGELALIKEMQKVKKYYFSGSGIRFDIVVYSLANSLNKFLTHIEFTGSFITDDGLRIFLSVLKVKMTEAKAYNYNIGWDGSTDLNALGLEELFKCVRCQKLTVFNSSDDDGNTIIINNSSSANSFLHIKVDYNHIKADDIKQFLNKNKNKNLVVEVKEWDEEALPLITMINIMKDFPMKLIIFWLGQLVREETARKVMEGLIKTNLDDFTIDIENLTNDIYQMIFDKLKNIKLQNLSIRNVQNMIDLNPQTVVKPLQIPGLKSLCIQECMLDDKLSKEILLKLEHSKLETFELIGFDFNTKLANILSNSLIGSNLVELMIRFCNLRCEEVKIVAEALKDTKITLLDLTANRIKNAGVKAIANVVKQTKLNTLILDRNEFDECSAIELLKSVQNTKIVRCWMDNCKNIAGSLDAIAKVLKDNKILLNCIEKGENTKIDEYLERNNNSLKKAKFIIDKYQKGSISYDYKHKEHFEAYESFTDTDILWDDIDDDKQRMKLNLGNKIADNYLKICGVINNKLEVNSDYSKRQVNFSHLSLEILNNIFLYLNVSDVLS